MTARFLEPAADTPRLLSTARLLETGLSDRAVHRQVRDGTLIRIRPGWFVDAVQYRGLRQEEKTLLTYQAYVRTSTASPVLCLASAALVHGLRLYRVPTRIHTLSAPGHGTHNGAPDIVRHQAPLPESDVVELQGIRATSGERTLLDCARFLPRTDAVVLADQAHALGMSRARLEQRLLDWKGRRGARRARTVLDSMDVRAESVGETLTRLMLAERGLPEPRTQWVIEGRSGRYRADFAWPEYRLVLEFDGEGKYAGAAATVIRDERRREVEIQELGWAVIRVGWNDVVRTPDATAARIGKAMHAARTRG